MLNDCSVHNADDFRRMVGCMVRNSLSISRFLVGQPAEGIGRTALGGLLQESSRLEELLDAYGARTNQEWLPFRRSVAALKLFSDVHYKILHIKYSIPLYALMPIDHDIGAATDTAVDRSTRLLVTAIKRYLDQAQQYGLGDHPAVYQPRCVENEHVTWRLDNDLVRGSVKRKPDETVVELATAFLNEVEGSDFRGVFAALADRGFLTCVPDVACEKDFRRFEEVFHNLQALYDSYVGGTDLEQRDEKLAFLRGHATIVYHLLEIVTDLTHHYERHMAGAQRSDSIVLGEMSDDMAWLVVSYAMEFAVDYATSVQDLCRELIRRYTESTTLTLPSPPYRGFHVRPSTLIARIVRHYGSKVLLQLEDEQCDASAPLEIIRVNERINAIKRRMIGKDILAMVREYQPDHDRQAALTAILLELFRQKKLVVYSDELSLDDVPAAAGESLGEYSKRAVAQLLAGGAIDIRADIPVSFQGDKRALDDLKVLADAGYGEDQVGNNIPLPTALSYLKR
ncbi:MAG: hypothetical protein EA403_03420 [Spirochaetaceae bacterium]|nr:MAG: hypothetical protein EA403_03420 [Spirochaetaceae bacterium]